MSGSQISEIEVKDLEKYVKAGCVLIDVREEDEIEAAGTIDGCKIFPLSHFDDFKNQFPTDKDIVFFCRSGRRSLKAAELASAWTKKHLYSLAGGFIAYSSEKK